MSDQLARYFAATLGCAITAMWAAAGVGPALACLAVALASYAAAALVQRGSIGRLLRHSRDASGRIAKTPSSRGRARPSGPPRKRPARTPTRRPPPKRAAQPGLDYELDSAEPVLSGPGPYGW
jgi:hypothetical protein